MPNRSSKVETIVTAALVLSIVNSSDAVEPKLDNETNTIRFFESVCFDGSHEPKDLIKAIESRGLDTLSESQAMAFPWGVLGHDIRGWYDPDTDSVLVVQVAGRYRQEARDLNRSGGIGRSQPINRYEDIGVFDWDPSYSGTVSCKIFSNSLHPFRMLYILNNIEYEDVILGKPNYEYMVEGIGRFQGIFNQVFIWRQEPDKAKKNIVFSYEMDASKEGEYDIELSADWILPVLEREY